MPEITTITSESLQAEVRRLLPSQRGFGGDLEAQNVIVPIIDLTPTAEGSALRDDLQTASSFVNVTAANSRNAGAVTLLSSPGFYKYKAALSILSAGSADSNVARIDIKDGLGAKLLHMLANNSDTAPEEPNTIAVEGICFLRTGDSLVIDTTLDARITISAWPIADVNGNFINPGGFSFE